MSFLSPPRSSSPAATSRCVPVHTNDLIEMPADGCSQVIDKPGQEEVELVRKFGDETIRVVFSVSDLNAISEEMTDESLYDDEHPEDGAVSASSAQSGGAQSKETHEKHRQEEDEDFDAQDDIPSFPARLNITIEKVTVRRFWKYGSAFADGIP